eukprot:155395_1
MTSFLVTIYLLACCFGQPYIFIQQNMSFSNSEAYCSFAGDANLASIHTIAQNDEAKALATVANSLHTWIGLTDANSPGTWIWNDNSPLDFGYNISGGVYPWEVNQPNWSGDCTALSDSNKNWDDVSCINANPSLCNYPKPIDIFNDDSDYQRIPSYNNIIGTMDILDEIYIEFDFIVNSWNYSIHQWTCILLVGKDN